MPLWLGHEVQALLWLDVRLLSGVRPAASDGSSKDQLFLALPTGQGTYLLW